MRNGYANISYTIGRGIDQRRECVENDALSDRLLGLLDRFGEQDESKAPSLPPTVQAPTEQVYRRLAEIFEEAAADSRNTPGDRALLAEKTPSIARSRVLPKRKPPLAL